MRLAEKVAMVTGGGAGIGRAITLRMAREGADVLVADIRLDSAEGVAKEVRDLGRRAAAMLLDVTQASQVHRVIADGIRQFGRINIL
ncbi:MAG TPA: SDR family NAD(P)-dependent oxidoreductase, partial [Candidatus Methylomirabilis sp.]|nr:SDR family NAD(P)-dependent oxidoreductase [Candidatus Methylomirabilis sp.]